MKKFVGVLFGIILPSVVLIAIIGWFVVLGIINVMSDGAGKIIADSLLPVSYIQGEIESLANMPESIEDGIDAGINADDWSATVVEKFNEKASLEPMETYVTVRHQNTVGNPDDPYYVAEYIYKGKVVFKIDLSQISKPVIGNDKVVYIEVPEPEAYFYADMDMTEEPFYEFQKIFDNGSKTIGFQAYIKNANSINEKIEEGMIGYEENLKTAKILGEEELLRFINNISVKDDYSNIKIKWKERKK